MKNFIAHLFGLDKDLIKERNRSYQLESQLMETKSAKEKIYDSYRQTLEEAIRLNEDNTKLKERVEFLESQVKDLYEQIEFAGKEIEALNAAKKKKRGQK